MDQKILKWISGAGTLITVGAILTQSGMREIMNVIENPGVALLSAYSMSGLATAEPDIVNDQGFNQILQFRSAVVAASQHIVNGMLVLLGVVILVFVCLIVYILYNQRKNRKALEVVAYIDPITNRNNYNKLKQDAQEKLFSSYTQPYALVSMDVDRFKALNDVYGYERGNEVLRAIGDVVAIHLEDDEMFGRMVSDHFTLLMKYESKELLFARLQTMLAQIYIEVDVPYLQMAVGIYVITDPGVDFSLMNDRANMAKKESKRKANLGFICYQDYMRDTFLLESELEGDMQLALESQEFEIYLQPKYGLPAANICGAEALIRWNHSTRGFLLPKDFIPLFEQNGFIIKLDMYVLDHVCQMIAYWMREGREPYPISVNLSRLHMNNENLADELFAVVHRYRIPTNYIEFELTETTLDLNTKNLIPTFLKLKHYGFSVAIDDFGSGYSSLKLLKDIPADILKIDRDFFHRMESSDREKIVIENVIHMASALDIRVVSEGVETLEQVEFLSKVGCDVAQGFYFARPMCIPEFEKIAF